MLNCSGKIVQLYNCPKLKLLILYTGILPNITLDLAQRYWPALEAVIIKEREPSVDRPFCIEVPHLVLNNAFRSEILCRVASYPPILKRNRPLINSLLHNPTFKNIDLSIINL